MGNGIRVIASAALCALACATAPVDKTDRPVSQGDSQPTPVADEPPRADPLSPPADVAAPPADAAMTSTGLASKVLRAGTGHVHPGSFSVVRVHYTGWTTDGKVFDSSVQRGAPAEFPLNG